MTDVRLDLTPGSGRIEIDGVDIAKGVSSLQVEVDAGERRVTLEFPLQHVTLDGDATVRLSEDTEAALVALGWTPPDAAT